MNRHYKLEHENNYLQHHKRTFFQPLTLALVMILFVALILVMGVMDLGRLDKTLVDFLEDRGLDIITSVENVAQENLNYLYQTLKEDQEENAFVPLTDKAFSPQESLIKELVDLAREIDVRWKEEQLNEKDMREIAERENLWLIAALDEKGKVVFQSRTLLQDIPPPAASPISRHEEIMIDLFNRLGKLDEIGYVALRRKDGSGTIVIALDDSGLRYWSTKIAVRKAIEEVGWGQGSAYLVVTNPYGKIYGRTGNLPDMELEKFDSLFPENASGQRGLTSQKTVHGEMSLQEIRVPFYLDKKLVGYACLGLERAGSDRILKENRNRMIISMLLIVAIGILSMVALYHNQKRHIDRIEEMEKKLRQAERLSALGQLAAGVAHEIRNPLNAISMASQRIQRQFSPSEDEKKRDFAYITGIIREEIRRLNDIIEEFVTFSKTRRLKLQDHSVIDILQRLVSLMEEEAAERKISFKTVWKAADISFPMDIDKLKQAFYNIFKNAMESISGGGMITIAVEAGEKGRVITRITDTGSGLTSEEIEHIFSPEYTTKEKGLGLGLPIAHEIIRGHGGDIHVQSTVGEGTTFEIVFPVNRGGEKKVDSYGETSYSRC